MASPRRRASTTQRSGYAVLAFAALMSVAGGCTRAPERSIAAFCDQIDGVEDIDEVLASGNVQATRDEVEQLRRLQEVSPSEIEPQVANLVAITRELADAMATAGDARKAADQVFARHQGDLPQITGAGQAVERFTADHCQVFLNPTGTTPSGSAVVPGPPPPPPTSAPSTTAGTRSPTSSTQSRATTSRPSATTTSTRASTTTRARSTAPTTTTTRPKATSTKTR